MKRFPWPTLQYIHKWYRVSWESTRKGKYFWKTSHKKESIAENKWINKAKENAFSNMYFWSKDQNRNGGYKRNHRGNSNIQLNSPFGVGKFED